MATCDPGARKNKNRFFKPRARNILQAGSVKLTLPVFVFWFSMSRLLAFGAFLWVLLGWCALPIGAQPLPDRVPLRGVVLDQYGKPLSGVFVSLRRQDTDGLFGFWGAEAASDAQGNFVFPTAEEGHYYLNGELGGYAPALNRPIDLKKGLDPVQIVLIRLVTAHFRVLSPDGKPWVSQPLWIRLSSTNGESVVRNMMSDSRGSIVVTGVVSGNYSLSMHTASGYATQSVNLLDSASGTPIEVRLQTGGTLRVMAHDSSGEAIGGAILTLNPATADEAARLGSPSGDTNDEYAFFAAEGDRALIATRDGDGVLELRQLPPGRYLVDVAIPGYSPIAPRLLNVEEGQTLTQEWTFLQRRVGSLTLDLRTPDDKPVANRVVTVRVVPINTNGTIAREAVDENGFPLPFFPSGTGVRRAISDASGRLRLFPVRPGRYRVFVAPAQPSGSDEPPRESSPLDLDVSQNGATSTVVIPK